MRGYCKKLTSLFLLLLCASCSKQSLKTRMLLDWWPNPNHVAIYAGIQKGIFAKHGIDLEVLALQDPPDAITYLRTNQADIGVYYLPLTLRAFAKEDNISVIGKLTEEPLQGFICRADSGIDSFRDFDGKVLGAFSDGMTAAYHKTLEEKEGIKFSGIKHVQFDVAAALFANTIDIISGVFWNIEPEQLRANGVETKTFRLQDIGVPTYSELVFLASEKFRQNEPKKAHAFATAMQEAIDYAVANPEAAFAAYMSAHPDKTEATRIWEERAWRLTAPVLAKSQHLNREETETYQEWLFKNRLIVKKCNLDRLEFNAF